MQMEVSMEWWKIALLLAAVGVVLWVWGGAIWRTVVRPYIQPILAILAIAVLLWFAWQAIQRAPSRIAIWALIAVAAVWFVSWLWPRITGFVGRRPRLIFTIAAALLVVWAVYKDPVVFYAVKHQIQRVATELKLGDGAYYNGVRPTGWFGGDRSSSSRSPRPEEQTTLRECVDLAKSQTGMDYEGRVPPQCAGKR